jgi:hypothetical protein
VLRPSGTLSHTPITLDQLLHGETPTGLTSNSLFAPGDDATDAPPFEGTLQLAGAVMAVNSQISNPVHGKDTTYFPDVDLLFFTDRQRLVR